MKKDLKLTIQLVKNKGDVDMLLQIGKYGLVVGHSSKQGQVVIGIFKEGDKGKCKCHGLYVDEPRIEFER